MTRESVELVTALYRQKPAAMNLLERRAKISHKRASEEERKTHIYSVVKEKMPMTPCVMTKERSEPGTRRRRSEESVNARGISTLPPLACFPYSSRRKR